MGIASSKLNREGGGVTAEFVVREDAPISRWDRRLALLVPVPEAASGSQMHPENPLVWGAILLSCIKTIGGNFTCVHAVGFADGR